MSFVLSAVSSKTWQDVWMLEFEHLSLIKEKNEWKNDAKYLKLQAVLDLCKKHGVLNLKTLAPVYLSIGWLYNNYIQHFTCR